MSHNELTGLKRIRDTYKRRLTQFEAFIEDFRESNEPIEILEARIEFIQNTWPGFDTIQTKIEDLDDKYCTLIGKARALVNNRR